MPSFSAAHDQEYTPRHEKAGWMQDRNSAGFPLWIENPAGGGGGDWEFALPEQIFAGMSWRAYRRCGGELPEGTCISQEAMAKYSRI